MKKVYYIGCFVSCFILAVSFSYIRNQSLSSIDQASQALTDIENSGNLTEIQLKQQKEKIGKVIFWLKYTPNLPQMPYHKAQEQLQMIEDGYNKIDTNLKNSQAAKNIIKDAEKIVAEFGQIDFTQPRDVSYWESAKDVLSKAIQQLENIPPALSSDIQGQIADTLTNFKSQYSEVESALNAEKQAATSLSRAESLNQQAAQVLGSNKPSTSTLENAKLQVNEAIDLASSIPSTTTVSNQAQRKISDYQGTLRSVSSQLEEAIRNACPYTPDHFSSTIANLATKKYMLFGGGGEIFSFSQGESILEEITRNYEDPRCENIRSQVRNLLISAWENHYNKEYDKLKEDADIQYLRSQYNALSCQGYGCEEPITRNAEYDRQVRYRQLDEERRNKVGTIRNRLR